MYCCWQLGGFPGAAVVVGNDWPFYYDIRFLQRACREFGWRVVNAIKTLGGVKEDAVLDFMSTHPEPFVVVASLDFEFRHFAFRHEITQKVAQNRRTKQVPEIMGR